VTQPEKPSLHAEVHAGSLSIEPFEGTRWRLRGMRPVMATYRYGISIELCRLVGWGAGRRRSWMV